MTVPDPPKCEIRNFDSPGDEPVYARFNPTSFSINKNVPWSPHNTKQGNNPVLEFTDAEPQILSVELLFDTYEKGTSVYQEYISKLESLTLVGPDERPPMCQFVWGTNFPGREAGGFKGVISKLDVTYKMFLSDGTPCRATANITMKQATSLKVGVKGGVGTQAGTTVQEGQNKRSDQVYGDAPGQTRAGLNQSGSENGELTPGQVVPKLSRT